MEVLHVMWNGQVGGAERAVYQLVRAQRKYSQYKPVMAYCQADGYYVEQLRHEELEVIPLGMRNGRDFGRLFAIKQLMLRFPIHHFQSADLVPMFASASCRRATRVYTHRGGASTYPLKKAFAYRLAGLLLKSSFHALSGNTRRACVSGPKVLGVRPSGWEVTYNGLDFSLLRPDLAPETVAERHRLTLDGKPVIGTSANLRSWKRIDLLLKACSQMTDVDFILLIVGDGQDRNRLEELTDNLGLRQRVVFTGRQEHVAAYLAVMDIFVLPSNSEESFGNSVVEAMAMGLPSIVFEDGGGLTEHIQDGRSGFVVNSVEHLTARLRQLIAAPDLRDRLGSAASAAVRERYTLEAMVKRYDALYDAALRNAGNV